MQLSDIKKLKTYYDDLVSVNDPLLKKKHISEPLFTIKGMVNYLLYGTSFSEYAGYGFYGKSRKEKKEYMTRRYLFRFFDRYNPEDYRDRIGDKSLAVNYYSDFLNREQITKNDGIEAFKQFTARHPNVFIKKAVGWGGEGARTERINSEEDAESIWDSLSDDMVVEPVIENHRLIKEIYPNSLNTIKITTLQTKAGPEIVSGIIRFGNNSIVDNIHSGGMAAGIDIATGRIETLAIDRHFQRYSHHPETDKPITGVVIPEWERIKSLAIKASLVTPQLRYSSWDIALTDDGPILIEGNWDAEFYMGQVLTNRGNRKRFIDMLEK